MPLRRQQARQDRAVSSNHPRLDLIYQLLPHLHAMRYKPKQREIHRARVAPRDCRGDAKTPPRCHPTS
eukprot:9456005-Heterocapsa_arctica.AAC.1